MSHVGAREKMQPRLSRGANATMASLLAFFTSAGQGRGHLKSHQPRERYRCKSSCRWRSSCPSSSTRWVFLPNHLQLHWAGRDGLVVRGSNWNCAGTLEPRRLRFENSRSLQVRERRKRRGKEFSEKFTRRQVLQRHPRREGWCIQFWEWV